MFRFTLRRLLLIHSPKGVAFTLSADEAIVNIKNKYGSRWFGADLLQLSLATPSKEFVPFYLAKGYATGVFTGRITYTSTTQSNGKSSSGTETIYTKPQPLNTIFTENRTQVYGGFKYHLGHVRAVLQSESIPLLMQPMSQVPTRGATINLFEQTTLGTRDILEEVVIEQMKAVAMERVRSFHPNASTVDVDFVSHKITIEELTPVFLPCYVVKATYNGARYTLYVSGRHGTVGGPYLLNAEKIAFSTSLATFLAVALLLPNKALGLLYACLSVPPVYLLSFTVSKYYPLLRRNRNRRHREVIRRAYEERAKRLQEDDTTGNYRPNPQSRRQRVSKAYRTSTYWDTHAFQQRSTGWASGTSSPLPADPKGYYRLLGLRGDESVNEIRSSYRKVVLREHPDVGGRGEVMAELNAAYRVLRDPQRRAEYDRMT